MLGKHAKRIKLVSRDECRYCKVIDSVEDVRHIITECDALARTGWSMPRSLFGLGY